MSCIIIVQLTSVRIAPVLLFTASLLSTTNGSHSNRKGGAVADIVHSEKSMSDQEPFTQTL